MRLVGCPLCSLTSLALCNLYKAKLWVSTIFHCFYQDPVHIGGKGLMQDCFSSSISPYRTTTDRVSRCVCVGPIRMSLGPASDSSCHALVSNASQNVRSLPARPLVLRTAACPCPCTSVCNLPYPPFSFLSTHPFCQRLIGLEMIWFILAVNAVIMLLFWRKKRKERKTTPHVH